MEDWALGTLLPALPDLADALASAMSFRKVVRRLSKVPFIGQFYACQIGQDLTYGPDPLVKCAVDWLPCARGAAVGLRLALGQVAKPEKASAYAKSRPDYEEAMARLVVAQDREFRRRGLDFTKVAAPGLERLTLSAFEHSLCEFGKYVGYAVGDIKGARRYQPKEN